MPQAKPNGVVLFGAVVLVVVLFFVGRQIIVGDATSLIAHLWVATMDVVFQMLRPLLGA